MTPVEELTDAFQGYLKRRNKAEGTQKRYREALAPFVLWLGEKSPALVTPRDFELSYLPWWEDRFVAKNGRTPTNRTLGNQIQAVKAFYSFLERFDFLVDESGKPTRNPMVAIDSPTRVQKRNNWLREDEDQTLLASVMNAQEMILVYLLRFTGLRIAEALSLKQSDVCLSDSTIYVRESKTERGIRQIPITPELKPFLRRWLETLHACGLYNPNAPFLTTDKGTAWKPQHAEKLTKRVALRAGVRDGKVTPHTLRRTFGSSLINRKVRLEVVSRLLGHSSTAITEQAYAELLHETIRDEYLAVA